MDKKIVLGRYRTTEYIVNYDNKKYAWAGSKPNKIDKKSVNEEVYNFLQMNTSCFSDGELVIIPQVEEDNELLEEIVDKESYLANTHTREEIVKILEGNINKMKSELNKITNKEEKQFVLNVAKEIKLDSSTKRKFLVEWVGTQLNTEEVFEN